MSNPYKFANIPGVHYSAPSTLPGKQKKVVLSKDKYDSGRWLLTEEVAKLFGRTSGRICKVLKEESIPCTSVQVKGVDFSLWDREAVFALYDKCHKITSVESYEGYYDLQQASIFLGYIRRAVLLSWEKEGILQRIKVRLAGEDASAFKVRLLYPAEKLEIVKKELEKAKRLERQLELIRTKYGKNIYAKRK